MVDTDYCKPTEKPTPSPANSGSEHSRNPLDINSILPLYETTPESDRVKLTPSILSLHAKEYAEQATAHPELHHYFVIDLSNLNKILTTVEPLMSGFPMYIPFAIISKAREGPLAGAFLKIKIAWVVLFSTFQRTYVTTNPVGFSLDCWLKSPKHARASHAQVCARAVDGPHGASCRVRRQGRWGLRRRA
ncbi:hypothetical protein BJV74DRAFT_820803 [Russula compacta]|nr:hypothetical protein BJV74DRAFT_820803 [Russula compacta]